MGQQSSRPPKSIYFHKRLPFFFTKTRRKTQTPKPEQPIKFLYKTNKKCAETPKNKVKNAEKFGFQTINNLKSVLDSVKNVNEVRGGNNNVKDVKNSVKGAKILINVEDSTSDIQDPRLSGVHGTKNNLKLDEKVVWNDANAPKPGLKGSIELRNGNNIDFNIRDLNLNKKLSENHGKRTKRGVKDSVRDVAKQNVPLRTKSEPNLGGERGRERHRHRRKGVKLERDSGRKVQQFGYEIQDVDGFLARATLEKPANIPVVLAFPSVLYRTRAGGYQAEISLPLGMVVNAIFKNQNWLYVQTPHAEEGYVSYSACLPLGIIPPPDDDKLSPCWEKSTDVFPKPSGNMTDTEKLSCKSECGNEEDTYCSKVRYRSAFSTCGEKSVDRLYLRAAAIAKGKGTRHTLLVINEEYKGLGKGAISVLKNEVVFLLSTKIRGWFYVKNKEGREGFIPSVIAGHGFL